MTDFGITPDDLRRLARVVEENGLSELRYEEGDLRVTLRTEAFFRPAASAVPPFAFPLAAVSPETLHEAEFEEAAALPAAGPAAPPAGVRIEAPIMGVFYRSSSPDSPPFVEVGDVIEVGQPVGLIEAMKVFSEVEAEVSGRVLAVVAENRQLVHRGDVLIIVDDAGGAGEG